MKGARSDDTWPIVRVPSDACLHSQWKNTQCLSPFQKADQLPQENERTPQTHHKGSRHNRTKETCSVTRQKEEKKDWKKQVRRG